MYNHKLHIRGFKFWWRVQPIISRLQDIEVLTARRVKPAAPLPCFLFFFTHRLEIELDLGCCVRTQELFKAASTSSISEHTTRVYILGENPHSCVLIKKVTSHCRSRTLRAHINIASAITRLMCRANNERLTDGQTEMWILERLS